MVVLSVAFVILNNGLLSFFMILLISLTVLVQWFGLVTVVIALAVFINDEFDTHLRIFIFHEYFVFFSFFEQFLSFSMDYVIF